MRATLIAILQQLNRVESMHEGRQADQMLDLADLERLLSKFWAIDQDHVKVPLALGLLVRNRLVEARGAPMSAPRGRGPSRVLYHITADGKRFLIEALEKTDRIA